MKLRRYELIRDCLAVALNYLVALSLWNACEAVFLCETGWPLKMALIVLPYILFAVRSTSKKLLGYLTLHIAITAVAVSAVVLLCEKPAVTIAVVAGYFVFSFSIRLKSGEPKEEAVSPIGAFAAMFASFLVVNYIEADAVIIVITKLALAFAVLYIPYMYICRFLWFDFMNRKTITDMPSARLFKAGFWLTLGIAGSTFLVLLALLDEKKLIELGRKIRNLLKRILQFLLSKLKFETLPQEDTYATATQGGIDFSQLVEDVEPSPIMLWLEKLVMIAATIIAVLGIIFLAVAIVVTLIRRFKGLSDKHTEAVSEDIVEIRERIEVKERRRVKRERLALTSADRIRRMYFKLAKENVQYTEAPEKYTAREFACFFAGEKSTFALEFCRLYEKARYSTKTVTPKDVKEAKEYYRKLSGQSFEKQ